MSAPAPFFFKQPFRYLKWASIHKPAYFYSIIIGLAGPVFVFTVPPIRKSMGYERAPKVPQTYPGTRSHVACEADRQRPWSTNISAVPKGPRLHPSGFEDES